MSNLDFYLARAAEARTDADNAALDNVRDRCLRAAAAWDAMAQRAQRGDTFRAKLAAEKEAAADSAATMASAAPA